MSPIHSLLLVALSWFAPTTAGIGAAADDAARDAAIAKLKQAGAIVQPVAKESDELTVNLAIQPDKIGDTELAPLADLAKVVELDLSGTKVTDAGMKVVAKLTTLTRLRLAKTALTDAGVAELATLQSLESLNLYGTKVTDGVFETVKKLANLKRLYLWQTGVTEAGVAALKSALPKLVVNTGVPPDKKPEIAPETKPEPTTCCEKAEAAGKKCDHPCCVAAAVKGRTCFKCNPTKATTCCEKAEAAGTECDHPCCVEARKAGKLCEKCNPPKKG